VARTVGANLTRTAHPTAAAAVVYVVRDVFFAPVHRIAVAVSVAFVTHNDDALALATTGSGILQRADVAAGAAVVGIVLQVKPVVDHEVAVVIQTVTCFRPRQNFAHAVSPGPGIRACLRAVSADADPSGSSGSVVARAGLPGRAFPDDAVACQADFRRQARMAAVAAIRWIGRQIDAAVAARVSSRRAEAGAIPAGLGICTGRAASAAVAVVTGRIDTGVAAERRSGGTEAGAILTCCSVGTVMTTASAVTGVAQEIDALEAA